MNGPLKEVGLWFAVALPLCVVFLFFAHRYEQKVGSAHAILPLAGAAGIFVVVAFVGLFLILPKPADHFKEFCHDSNGRIETLIDGYGVDSRLCLSSDGRVLAVDDR